MTPSDSRSRSSARKTATSGAIDVVERLEPSAYTAVSLAELYLLADRPDEVIELTQGVTNEDDATAILLVFRGAAFRDRDSTMPPRNAQGSTPQPLAGGSDPTPRALRASGELPRPRQEGDGAEGPGANPR